MPLEIYVNRLTDNLGYQDTAIAVFLGKGLVSESEAAAAVGMLESLRMLNEKAAKGAEVVVC